MRQVPYKINDLEAEVSNFIWLFSLLNCTQGNNLGTDSDNADFRGELNSTQKNLETELQELGIAIKDFRSIQVEYKDEVSFLLIQIYLIWRQKKLKDKHEAFNNSFGDMAGKFNHTKKAIEEKMKQNMEFGKRRRQTTAASTHHGDSSQGGDQFNQQ